MLYHPPTLPYCGLTIILSNPSRFDSKQLLSGTGGVYFNNECLAPEFNRWQCDIREISDTRDFLPNTKAILVLGEYALRSLLKDKEAQLNAQRGNINYYHGIPLIASYLPQEAVDMKDYESDFNPLVMEHSDDVSKGDEKKRYGKTSQKNYRFWLMQDTHKAIKIVRNNGTIPVSDNSVEYSIFPSLDILLRNLREHKNQRLFFDIETDANLNMLCFSYCFDNGCVYVAPLVRHDYSKAYGLEGNCKLLGALAIAIRDNTLVAHNGSGFDYFVLAHKYRIPIRKVYDTMLAQNRIYPEVEKSLGHCISLPWMFEPFHKDEANFAYMSERQEAQLWSYCGKDVATLKKLYHAQLEYASKIPGLTDSIFEVNSYVRAYLTTTMLGIHYKTEAVDNIFARNDKLMNRYNRWLEILIGEANLKTIRGTGKSDLPSSPKQCVTYFHTMLTYPVVSRTKTDEPSLAADAMYKLKLKMTNPVIDIILAYRARAKESGSLKFTPWKEEPNKQ